MWLLHTSGQKRIKGVTFSPEISNNLHRSGKNVTAVYSSSETNYIYIKTLSHDCTVYLSKRLPSPQFSDMLLYTSKSVTGASQFRIRGFLPLRGMLVSGVRLT